MVSLILTGLKIYAEDGILPDAAVVIENGLIQSIDVAMQVQQTAADEVLSFSADCHLVPGFIDLHVHGANGSDVMDSTVESLQAISKALAMEGTTGFLATTMTASKEDIQKSVSGCSRFYGCKT